MDAFSGLLIPLLFLAVLYFLLIRPQQKRQREHRDLIASLQKGDDVITIGGMHGRVQRVADDYVDLEVTDDTVLRFQRQAVARKVTYGEHVEESSKA
ncbi:MAG: preprotein translocase subunit YajC [Actinomycetota bacterium]|nr:preprotein translocase subunit YajC [Actinomycetota bacterium]